MMTLEQAATHNDKTVASAEIARLRAALMEIQGHLGAAKQQTIPSDDRIIAKHVTDAYELARSALR